MAQYSWYTKPVRTNPCSLTSNSFTFLYYNIDRRNLLHLIYLKTKQEKMLLPNVPIFPKKCSSMSFLN